MNAFQELDVHNMTRTQAVTAIDAALRRANAGVYRIRDELKAAGIEITDIPHGAKWKRI